MGRVDEGDGAQRVDFADAVGHGVDQSAEARFALAKRGFSQ
jgi:hypothetical protein